jgi:hypothetical protein
MSLLVFSFIWCETLTNLPLMYHMCGVFFTGDQLVSFNLIGSTKPVCLLQISNFSHGRRLIIIFDTLLLIWIFLTMKDFIFVLSRIHWYLILICFDREWIRWCSLKWIVLQMSQCNKKFFCIKLSSYKKKLFITIICLFIKSNVSNLCSR